MPTLWIDHLTISYQLQNTWLDAVSDVSLSIEAGQTYGLVGESGSGKSTLAQAIMRYLDKNGTVRRGSIYLDDDNLLTKSDREMRQIWGARLSMVPQDPLTALNPSIKVGEQIAEVSRLHDKMAPKAAWNRAIEMLTRVKIADPERVAQRYPHQLSGGMLQRALIAMALCSTTPRLLILDEPTTSLDVTTEASILDLFAELRSRHNAATLFVTHNLGVVARMCDRVAVLYAGEMMEDTTMPTLFQHSLHPYTRLLLAAVPRIGQDKNKVVLSAIPGQIPSLRARPTGCVFAPRCPAALELCYRVKPPMEEAAPGHCVRCHRWQEIANGSLSLDSKPERAAHPNGKTSQPPETLLDAQHVYVRYQSGGLLNRLLRGKPPTIVKAVDDVSLSVPRGRIVGLVGESGSGKTSFARSVIGLVHISSGEVRLLDMPLRGRPRWRAKAVLQKLQMVFQHPEESLNPYHTVGTTLRRPLMTLAGLDKRAADARVADLLKAVNLPADYASRFPNELSGGEKQRVAIARAFAAQPDLIVCDEPVSSLDVSVQASVLNLLARLQSQFNAAYLFISHDLAVVGYLADLIAVIYLGQIVEMGEAATFFDPPFHPYAEALLSSIAAPDPTAQRRRIRLDGEIPSAVNIPTGCRFHTRCPRRLGEICDTQEPPWRSDNHGRQYRCHIPADELYAMQTDSPKESAR
jgi:peptide/nickel transport system ATP-binding protein